MNLIGFVKRLLRGINYINNLFRGLKPEELSDKEIELRIINLRYTLDNRNMLFNTLASFFVGTLTGSLASFSDKMQAFVITLKNTFSIVIAYIIFIMIILIFLGACILISLLYYLVLIRSKLNHLKILEEEKIRRKYCTSTN